MQKAKILHLITGLDIGGAEMMLLRTLPLLTNFENIVCYLNQKNSSLVLQFKNKGIKTELIGGNGTQLLKAIFDFHEIVKKENPDILVTYLIRADFFGRIFGKIFGVKKIVCSIRSSLQDKKFIPWLILNTLTSSLVTCFTTNSQSSKNLYSTKWHIPARKIITIYNGIEIEKFNPPLDVIQKRKDFKIAPENYIIGNIGGLRKERGQKYLLEALPCVLKTFSHLTLILVGDGKERKSLEELTEKLKIKNNLLFLGERRDIQEILKILDIFINPSLMEGMSNALIEAAASKCAIIANDIPPNREVIEHKKSGMLVPVKNPEKLATAIIELLENPDLRKTCAENAFQMAQEKFSLQKTIQELDNFFHKVLLSSS